MERTQCGPEQLDLLVKIGCFRFIGKSKQELLWEAAFLQSKSKRKVAAHHSLFTDTPYQFTLPVLDSLKLEDLFHQIELLGSPLDNPFILVDEDPDTYIRASQLPAYLGQQVEVLVYYVCQKNSSTKKKKPCFSAPGSMWKEIGSTQSIFQLQRRDIRYKVKASIG